MSNEWIYRFYILTHVNNSKVKNNDGFFQRIRGAEKVLAKLEWNKFYKN